MLNSSSLTIIQKYILLATGMPSQAARECLTSIGATDVTFATSTDATQDLTDSFIEGNAQGEVIAENGDGIQNSDEFATIIYGGSGSDSESTAAIPLVAPPLSSLPATPPASLANDDCSNLII